MTVEFPTRFKGRLASALLILRLSLGLFLLLWALEKFIQPQTTQQIWSAFYKIPISGTVVTILAILQTILAIALIVGFLRSITYGIALGINAVTFISTWQQLLDPWGLNSGQSTNHLFLAGIPVLAGFIALYLLHSWDRWSVDGWLKHKRIRSHPPESVSTMHHE
jgi:putative oxidoreductase